MGAIVITQNCTEFGSTFQAGESPDLSAKENTALALSALARFKPGFSPVVLSAEAWMPATSVILASPPAAVLAADARHLLWIDESGGVWKSDASSRVAGTALVSVGSGGGSGGGATGTVITIASGATHVLTTPGPTATAYSDDVVTLRLAGATGGFVNSTHFVDGVLPPIRQAVGAEVSFVRSTTDFGASWRIAGVLPGGPIGEWALADLLALSATAYTGCVARTTINGRSALIEARGGRWVYLAGLCRVGSLLTPPTAVQAPSYTIPAGGSILVPGGLRGLGDRFEVTIGFAKVGSLGTAGYTLYCGTTGTTSDPVVRQSSIGIAAGATAGTGFTHKLIIDAAGTIRAQGSNNPIRPLSGAETSPAGTPASVGVTGLTGAGDLYFSVGLQVANGADSLQLTTLDVDHLPGV